MGSHNVYWRIHNYAIVFIQILLPIGYALLALKSSLLVNSDRCVIKNYFISYQKFAVYKNDDNYTEAYIYLRVTIADLKINKSDVFNSFYYLVETLCINL